MSEAQKSQGDALASALNQMNQISGVMVQSGQAQAAEVVALRTALEAQTKAMQRDIDQRGAGMIDKSGVGKPQVFDGTRTAWVAWCFKMETWVAGQFEAGEAILTYAREQGDHSISDSEVTTLATTYGQAEKLSRHLYQALVGLCAMESEPLEIVQNSNKNNGLDAWRRLCFKYDPNNEHTSMALLKKIMHPERVSISDLALRIEKWEADYKKYRNRTGEQLTDAMQRMCLNAMVPEELLGHLELNAARLKTYESVKTEAEKFVEARIGRDTSGAVPMDIGALMKFQGTCYYCGKTGHRVSDCRKKRQDEQGKGGQGAGKGSYSPSTWQETGKKGQKGKSSKGSKKGKGKGKGTVSYTHLTLPTILRV